MYQWTKTLINKRSSLNSKLELEHSQTQNTYETHIPIGYIWLRLWFLKHDYQWVFLQYQICCYISSCSLRMRMNRRLLTKRHSTMYFTRLIETEMWRPIKSVCVSANCALVIWAKSGIMKSQLNHCVKLSWTQKSIYVEILLGIYSYFFCCRR